ncbi:MAG: ABC transporter substrate-binding protein [Acidobacteriota bacterium]
MSQSTGPFSTPLALRGLAFGSPRSPRVLLAAVTALALLLISCGEAAPNAPDLRSVTVAHGVDMEGVNELLSSATSFNTVMTHFALFLGLAEEQADYQDGPPTFAPQLAKSWELSEDGLAVTFFLRDDVLWSDGVPITAEDIRFTWQAQVSEEVGWIYAEFKKRIRDVEVIDPATVRFHFYEPSKTQLFDAVQGVILPKHAWGELPFAEWRGNGQWFLDNLVVSGPFQLESWQPGQRIVLRRNERYYEPGLPKLDRLVFEIVPDVSNQLNLLRAGQADFLELVPYAEAESLQQRPDLYLTSFIPRNYYFVSWNLARKPFDVTEVRRALTLGIDRQAIIDSQFYGRGTLSFGPLASDVWAHHDGLEPWPYQPEEARRLLAEAGFADADGDGVLEKDGEPFRIELLTNSDNALRQDILVMIQDQLKRIGVEVVARTMEFNSMIPVLNAGEFDGAIMGLSIGTDLDLSFNFATGGGLNWGGFSDPQTDALIEEINAGGGALETLPQLRALQERLHEMQPVTFLYEGERLSGVQRRLQDVDPNSISAFANLRHWRLQDAAEAP